MDKILIQLKSIRIFTEIYVAVLLFSFHFFFVYFINSTYLSLYVGNRWVSLLYVGGGMLTVLVFLNASRLLNRFGNYLTIMTTAITEAVVLLGMGLFPLLKLPVPITLTVLIGCFVIQQAVSTLLIFNLDIFLERYSADSQTGGIRGMYLTMMNIPPIITPFIAGLILIKPDFWKVYTIGAVFMVPFIIIIISSFRDFKDPIYTKLRPIETARIFFKNRDLLDIFIDNFLLHFFYAWMAVYTPIYLYEYMGFSLPEIGLMLSIALLPFVLFQIPLGTLADRKLGEKEILIAGFLIVSVCTLLIPNVDTPNFILWAILLFMTRVGASFIEVSSEAYFFKKVSAEQVSEISFFRLTRSLPYLVAPLIFSLSLLVVNFRYSFVVLGAIMLIGVRYAFLIHDTR
ncbi:MAG: MFS transporter [Candidatus Pacebacteria bacterium]|nr:MFS transporter [Candidatus Paceibacterota bacterium]